MLIKLNNFYLHSYLCLKFFSSYKNQTSLIFKVRNSILQNHFLTNFIALQIHHINYLTNGFLMASKDFQLMLKSIKGLK